MPAKWRKSSLWLIPLLFLAPLSLSNLGAATPDTATLRVDPPSIVNTGLTPGNTFSINVTVVNVENLWSYQFLLSYNTTILTVVGNHSYEPFTQYWKVKINETEGAAFFWYSLPFGSTQGFSGTTALGGIDFRVDALGVSPLPLSPSPYSKLSSDAGPIPYIIADGFFTNIKVHDVAITKVTASPARVSVPGELLFINVSLTNKSPDFDETFNVTVSSDHTPFANETDVFLASEDNTTLTVTWDTTGVALGEYNITARAILPLDNLPDNNVNTELKVRVGVVRDVAVISVSTTPNDITIGEPVAVAVTVKNLGNFTESVSVVAKYDGTSIGTMPANLLPQGAQSLTFNLETKTFAEGKYSTSAEAIVKIDDNLANNKREGDTLTVSGYYSIPPILLYGAVALVIVIIVLVIARRVLRARKTGAVVKPK